MNYEFKDKIGIICGGTNGIGFSIAKTLLSDHKLKKIYILGRDFSSDHLMKLKDQYPEKLETVFFASEMTDEFILPDTLIAETKIDFIINSVGVLKFNGFSPERRLEDVNYKQFEKTMCINAFTTLFLAKTFKKQLLKSSTPLFAAVSAKVGSIEDNKMGGWYSYRISKAALNMAMKNIALEFKNRNKESLVVVVHPGTTDTKLSEPFLEQARKKYKILTADESAKFIIDNLNSKNHGQFVSWDKEIIKW